VKNLSNWRAVRVQELAIERELRQTRVLWLHGFFVGLFVLALMWLAAFLQFEFLQAHSLALRYLVTLGAGYVGYLLVVRFWAAALLRGTRWSGDLPTDLPMPGSGDGAAHAAEGAGRMVSGQGGDFAGGGASADFGGADIAGDAAGGALQIAAAADEGAVVVIPVVVVFLIGLAVAIGAGSLLLLYFGWDVILAVAIELSFGYVSARTAMKVAREGWLSAAIRLTWKPLFGAVMAAVLLGVLINHFVPSAHSLPQAVRLIKAGQWK
jgi:hypothetical protein